MTDFQFWILIVAGGLHAAFTFAEMYPWPLPILLRRVNDKLSAGGAELKGVQADAVANIVKNAGIYNTIIAGGLFWAAYTGDRDVALVLLTGALVAGLFGTATLKSKETAVQAVLGAIGIGALYIQA